MTPVQQLNSALQQFGVAAAGAAAALSAFGRAFIFLDVHHRAGDWPDYYSLLNRYMRTNQLPKYFSGERWEA